MTEPPQDEAMKAPERNASAEELQRPQYWEEIYSAEGTPGWDIAQPAPALVNFLIEAPKPVPRPGRAIVLGCGFGHDAIAFAKHGYTVTALDCAVQAIERTVINAKEAGVTIETVQGDLFALPSRLDGAFDYVVEHTCFCAIHPTRRKQYAAVAHKLLKPGGQLVGVFYHHQRPGGPPFDTTPEDVRAAFSPLFDCRTLVVTPHSIERRKGSELFARFWRREV